MFQKRRCEALQPEEIDLLQRAFDRICVEECVARDSVIGEYLAAALIQQYQAGETDEGVLVDRARDRLASMASHHTLGAGASTPT